MTVETMARLAKLPNIVGVKDATNDVTRTSQQRVAMGPEFIQLSGDDGNALGQAAHGGHGCISVTANVAPTECAAFQNALLDGDFVTALKWQNMLMPLHDALFVETSPGPVKYAASLRGLCNYELRLPMAPVAASTEKTVRAAMDGLGLLNRSGG